MLYTEQRVKYQDLSKIYTSTKTYNRSFYKLLNAKTISILTATFSLLFRNEGK